MLIQPRAWTGLYCRLSWAVEHIDAFIADTLAPLLQQYVEAGRVTDWYYLRYWETGPHLRIRLSGASPDTVAELAARLRELVANAEFPVLELDPSAYYAGIGAPEDTVWRAHGEVWQASYEPETERYGGPAALPVAEQVFCRSTEVAVAVLRAGRSAGTKLTAAIELAMITARALDLDRAGAASWLRSMGASWRRVREPAPAPGIESHLAAEHLLATRGPMIAQRWAREPTGASAYWLEQVRVAHGKLDAEPAGRWLGVWASQLHMLFNRLGITPADERMICWLVASAVLSPAGAPAMHEGDTDQRYLEASKFRPGRADQYPRKHEPRQTEPLWWSEPIALPDPVEPSATLAQALAARQTSRGADLTGPLTSAQLASLLWTAFGGQTRHRPFPSAGASYLSRLRLIATRVDGLAPGTYQVDEAQRTLRLLGPAPSIADLESTSMWFGTAGGTELADVPVVLALSVRLADLRETYGARALRFAFAEAGHVAQNLELVAAAMSLPMGIIGGFYDDVAHDVFGLDGVSEVLVYLLPVGGSH
ncbi:MAG TPA: thiopeptide-type bacteriocin biosynthesis protein [Pseudonocardiaceae bacterium]|nr:thiopeptide-type bacteriocin biosynthesis protein [Pseudonocardiaceae bacterium]